jgi:hypothetical protein
MYTSQQIPGPHYIHFRKKNNVQPTSIRNSRKNTLLKSPLQVYLVNGMPVLIGCRLLLDMSSKNTLVAPFAKGIKNGREPFASVPHVYVTMPRDRFNVVMTLAGKSHPEPRVQRVSERYG